MLDTVPQHTPSPGSTNTQLTPDFLSQALEAHVSPAASVFVPEGPPDGHF